MNFKKSTYSSDQDSCVEVAQLPNGVALRDSKDPDGPVLRFTAEQWKDFLGRVKAER